MLCRLKPEKFNADALAEIGITKEPGKAVVVTATELIVTEAGRAATTAPVQAVPPIP